MMKLILQRVAQQATYTQGYLFIDNQYFCDTLEPHVFNPQTDRKGSQRVAMPQGVYRVDVRYSHRYHQFIPSICWRQRYCKFQHGSKPMDATGIIVGKNASIGWIEDSKSILQALSHKVHRAVKKGESVILVIR